MRNYSKTGKMPGRPAYRTPASFLKSHFGKDQLKHIQNMISFQKKLLARKKQQQKQ